MNIFMEFLSQYGQYSFINGHMYGLDSNTHTAVLSVFMAVYLLCSLACINAQFGSGDKCLPQHLTDVTCAYTLVN